MIKDGYTDIHMHVIPYADDGAEDFDDALAMLRIAYDEGIRNIIATPHSAGFDRFRNDIRKDYELLLEKVEDEKIGINLMLGSEIRIFTDEIGKILKCIKKGKYPTLNGTEMILAEFQSVERDFDAISKCMNMLIDSGYIPIIAHAERYQFTIDQIYTLKEHGCLIQINYADVIPIKNHPMTEKANIMLRDKMVSFIATDAHRSTRRTPHIAQAVDCLYNKYDGVYLDNILCAEDFDRHQ